ncbi:methyltransferase [Brevundimonas sp.]|uniref:tRNA1(Val) (adenine(37)-N6)-methyltransferase n=1 Tax=Brevundimonas sp. TaxID=1871086 RepID=UPI002617E9FA|nr:methyltransferase [Brevundimonas sp.]
MEGSRRVTVASSHRVEESTLLNGRVRLLQPARGYRAGMDAALLAAAVAARPGETVLEAGCGAGAVLCQIGARRPAVRFLGVEREADMAALARRNLVLNGLDGEVAEADVAAGFAALDRPRADWGVSNPPFFDDPQALRAPDPAKRGAWIADDGLEAWTDFLLAGLRDGGRILMIHRADRLADLLALLGRKAGSFRILPIQPHADRPAKRVIVQAVRMGRAPLVLLPALVLHDGSDAKHAPAAEAILRGGAALDLD